MHTEQPGKKALQTRKQNWLLMGAVALVGILALAYIFLSGAPKSGGQALATPTAQTAAQFMDSVAVPQAAFDISTSTPSAYLAVIPSGAEDNPTTPIITATISASTPKPQQAQAKPTIDVATLPNGVRYGDHKPNLPGRIVRITSPNIKLDTPVYEVYAKNNQWEVADYAAGHHYNTKNPGEGGNIVLSGHNNWHGEVFRYLENLKVGDEIDLWTLAGKQYKYEVKKVEKFKEAGASLSQRLNNGQVMAPTSYEQLTLITCWPYTTFTHRLVVTAKPVE